MIHCCLRVSSCVSLKSAQKLGLLITAAFSLALLAACSRGSAEGPQVIPAMPVKVQTIQDQSVGDTSEYVATIKSRNSATIMSDVEGWIFDIHVHSGQAREEGRHVDGDRSAAAARGGLQLRFAEGIQRSDAAMGEVAVGAQPRRLSASGVVSKQDLDQAQSTYDSALADVKSMDAQITQQQVQLKYYSVFAPTDGHRGRHSGACRRPRHQHHAPDHHRRA